MGGGITQFEVKLSDAFHSKHGDVVQFFRLSALERCLF